MLTVFVVAAMVQPFAASTSTARRGVAEARVALAFIRRRDVGTADRLGGELRHWLDSRAIPKAAAPTVRAAAMELRTMFEGHRTMWGGDPRFLAAARAAASASRQILLDLR